MREAIILFTRIPTPGHTKTRLMPCYTDKECAELHTCFLKDIIQQCKKTEKDLFVAYEPQEDMRPLIDLLDGTEHLILQNGDTLEKRMQYAFQEVLDQGYDTCILIGSDIPEIQTKQLNKAFYILQKADVVFIPTFDGGYCLVGLKKMIPEVFFETKKEEQLFPIYQELQQSSVLISMIDRLQKKGYHTSCFDMLSDIDVPRDIVLLRSRMWKSALLKNSFTGEYLASHHKISVIIPVFNEATTVPLIQKELQKMKGCEVIFVDGGSTDGTTDKILPSYKMLLSEKGRAKQMNTGALVSNGDILFFLHVDSGIPPNPLDEIRKVLQRHRWGCFGIKFRSEGIFMRLCGVMSNFRACKKKIVFGDQGIFIERILFFEIGMFQEIPLMEDYQMSMTLKHKQIVPGMTAQRIFTSGRRFQGGTVQKLQLIWRMNRMRKMYREGVNPEFIKEFYPEVR